MNTTPSNRRSSLFVPQRIARMTPRNSARIIIGAAAIAAVVTAISSMVIGTSSSSFLVSTAHAFPTPAIAPVAWQLNFLSELPRRITVEVPGSNVPKAFWYVTYTATNNTGTEQMFFPVIEIVDKSGNVTLANKGVATRVFERIQERERARPIIFPLQIAGTILQGEDQAKFGVAVWEETDARPGTFQIYFAGLSGEVQPLVGSDGKPTVDAEGKTITLRKTMQLEYTVRGDELYAGDPVVAGASGWVMR